MRKTTYLEVTFALLGFLICAGPAAAAPWTTVGSAGTIDEADLNLVTMNHGVAYLGGGAPVGSVANIRYNVVAVDDLQVGGAPWMQVRFKDNGAGAQVVLRLKAYNVSTGMTTTLLTFDSNDFEASGVYQEQEVFSCYGSFDFYNNAYYVDAEIKKTADNGRPALSIVIVGYTIC
ncbi:MAG: hypothetical protein N838_11405 [Thiohalocapsa sp. PB-PSB1]|jgi:hypothetical protein|nr:MAG: hypothetical protein N838_34640 [Thiohalocapsa sp. PB-PSB1]QQO53874.1 MAG: hypothetical protein N838_11405 [Thiohalocapsa sp. PB-PSB1]